MVTTVNGIAEITGLAGRDLGRSAWKAVSQHLVDGFAEVTGDHQWIHTDPARATEGPYGGTIAHGYLVLSWLVPMSAELLKVTGVGMVVNYGLNRVRFPAPVVVGGRIRVRARVLTASPITRDGVQLTRALTVEVDGGDRPACVAETVTNYYPAALSTPARGARSAR